LQKIFTATEEGDWVPGFILLLWYYSLYSLYKPTNALNKIQYNANYKIQLVTIIKILHISAPECHHQGVY